MAGPTVLSTKSSDGEHFDVARNEILVRLKPLLLNVFGATLLLRFNFTAGVVCQAHSWESPKE